MRQRTLREPKHPPTRAWAELLRLLEKKTQQEIAAESDVAQSAIAALVTRQSMPRAVTIFKLEKLGIKAAWWGQKVKGKAA